MNMFEEIEKTKAELPKAKTISKEFKKYKFNSYQIFAFVIYFIVLCLGIIFGNLFPACGTSSTLYAGNCLTTEFNTALMLGVWFCGLLVCVGIFAVGHIISLLESINQKIK